MYRPAVLLAVLAACGAPSAPPGAPDGPPHVPGEPGAGAHALAYYRYESHDVTIDTPPMTTQASGSTIVVSVGRGDAGAFAAPTDDRGNVYAPLDAVHPYTRWPDSGTTVYAATDARGGAGHVLTSTVPGDDEITIAAVEVIDGTAVADVSWTEVLVGSPLTSAPVTTTGPATLIAFWWGDGGAEGDKTAVPDDGFTVVDAILMSGSLVQGAVAVRDVTAAGTYDVTWTATPEQGAQLWLIAVQ
jgi:hypothetical protein